MNKIRCPWVPLDDPLYVSYHDMEWGVPVHNDRTIFEYLTLEGFQAGLSWRTVLHKRENFRMAFDGFDPQKISKYDETKIDELLENPGIIRNKLKIRAAISNAESFLEIQKEFNNFDNFIWQFVGGKPLQNKLKTLDDYQATTPESDALSEELKKRGFKFVGSTVCYAHMQATGMVNDHTVDCFRYKEIQEIGLGS